MTTLYPAALDALTNPTPSTAQNEGPRSHSQQHSDLNDAVEALQAKLGVNSSAVEATIDYKVEKGEVGFVDSLAPAYLKTVSDIINGERVSVLRNIPKASWAGIRAKTDLTDWRAAFADLLAAMGTAGFGELYVPAGRFNLASSLATPANVKLTGAAQKGVTLRFTSAANALVLGSGSQVRDLTVDGSGVALTGIFMDTVNNARVQDVTVNAMAFHGIAISNSTYCKVYGVDTLACAQRGVIIDPNSSFNQVIGLHTSGNSQAGVLIGHNSHHNIVRSVTAVNQGNAAVWVHNASYRNDLSGFIIKDSTAAALTPAVLIGFNAYDNLLADFQIESYDIGVLLRGGAADAGYATGHTRRNLLTKFRVAGNGTGVAGGAMLKLDSVDGGVSKVDRNKIANWIGSDFQFGFYDPNGTGAPVTNNTFDNIDVSLNVTTKNSLVLKGTGNKFLGIDGYTPVGSLAATTPPAVPAAGVGVANPYPFLVHVYVAGLPAGGNITIDGSGVGATTGPNNGNGMYPLQPGQTIAWFGGSAPTWTWFGA